MGEMPNAVQEKSPSRLMGLAHPPTVEYEPDPMAKRETLEKHLSDLDKKIIELNKNELDLTKLSWEASLAELDHHDAFDHQRWRDHSAWC